MSSFSVGGLATGLDTKGIVDQLMSLESRPKMRMDWNRQLWQARKASWGDLNTRLLSLQKFANTLMSPTTWTGATTSPVTSSNASQVNATVTGTPTNGSYAIDVSQLARGELSLSSGPLGPPTSGVTTTGAFYEANSDSMEAGDRVRTITTQSGAATGIGTGSTINVSWDVNGTTYSANFAVTNNNRMSDLTQFVQDSIGNGATAAFTANGEIQVTSAPGTANEVSNLTMTATDSGGTSIPLFNSQPGATSTQTVAATDGGVTAADTLTISQNGSTWNIALSAGDQFADVVNKINAVSGIGVVASLQGGGSQIQLASTTTGAAQAFTISSTGATAGNLGFAETQAAQDSLFTVDGTSYSTAANTNITSVIAGLSLDLFSATAGPVTLVVDDSGATTASQDWIDSTKKKVMDFVNQYNSVIDFIGAKTGEQKKYNAQNLGDYLQGPLARDYRFSSVSFDLRGQMSDSVAGLASGANMLSDIGITTSFNIGEGNSAGKLEVDEAALEAALKNDPSKVQNIMGNIGAASTNPTADDGFARRISEMVSLLRTGGTVDNGMQGATGQISRLQKSMDAADVRLKSRREYYERMFSNLETNIGKMQNQMGWLGGQFAQMSAQTAF